MAECKPYLTRSETWFIKADIEDASVEVLGPEGFPLSFSSSEATLGSLTSTGAEFEEFPTVAA